MLFQRFRISSRRQIWVALAFLTLAAIGFSLSIALLALKFTMTGDPNATHSEHAIYDNVLLFSILTPAVVCPIVVYTLLTTLHELHIAREELNAIAQKDSLTGLLNRRGFDDEARRLTFKARSSRKTVCALMCDIDLFKTINDTYGHDGGDAALRHVADVAMATMETHPDAVVGRQGGDEFAILVIDKSIRELASLAETIRRAVESAPVSWKDEDFFVTISLGVSISTSEDASVASLLSRADLALYEAKKRGRNRTHAEPLADVA